MLSTPKLCELTTLNVSVSYQEIIVFTGTETFAKEPKFAKSLRGIKWAPLQRQ